MPDKEENRDTPHIQDMLDTLLAYGYRFTRPLEVIKEYGKNVQDGFSKAIILDTETTGTNFLEDKIIELGMISFSYCPRTGIIGEILNVFDELEDPGQPIPAESTRIHHITNEMVKGRKISDSTVESFISDATIIIAHNAGFDRKFVETRFPVFTQKNWACTFQQIPWAEEGFTSAKLEFLAYKAGFHFDGHRADIDCHALLEVLNTIRLDSGQLPMQILLRNSSENTINVSALGSPFESKDKLKSRRYYWNPDKKTWGIRIPESELENEKEWLRLNIFNNKSFNLEIEYIDASNRFSNRLGIIEKVSC